MIDWGNERIGIEGTGLMILRLLGVLVGTSCAGAYEPILIRT